jgi:DnaK suppressor protein
MRFDELVRSERERAAMRIAELEREFEDIVEASAMVAADDEHDPEGSTVGFERAQVSALLAHARTHLAALDDAFERLRRGTYGTCERCGAQIAIERLVAQPAAVTCIGCAALADRAPPRRR